jgi:hypothetical protein
VSRLAIAALALVLCPRAVEAQLETGRRLLDEADFRRAIRAFDRAERSEDLSHEDLVLLYEGRAMARLANGDDEGAEHDLERLATVEPRHVFPAEAPPELAEALARIAGEHGGGLALELSLGERTGGSVVRVGVLRDPMGLTSEVRLHVRVDGGPWRDVVGTEASLEHGARARIEAYAEAIGPGGAEIARAGTEREPEVLSEEPAALPEPEVPARALVPDESPPSGGDDTALIVGLVIGGVALVGLAIGLGVGLGTQGPSDRTQPSAPMVEF